MKNNILLTVDGRNLAPPQSSQLFRNLLKPPWRPPRLKLGVTRGAHTWEGERHCQILTIKWCKVSSTNCSEAIVLLYINLVLRRLRWVFCASYFHICATGFACKCTHVIEAEYRHRGQANLHCNYALAKSTVAVCRADLKLTSLCCLGSQIRTMA